MGFLTSTLVLLNFRTIVLKSVEVSLDEIWDGSMPLKSQPWSPSIFHLLFTDFCIGQSRSASLRHLQDRVQLLQTFTIPSLARQRVRPDRWGIFVDERLPKDILNELHNGVINYPWIDIVEIRHKYELNFIDGHHINTTQEWATHHFRESGLRANETIILLSGIDSDDALSKRFVGTLHEEVVRAEQAFNNQIDELYFYARGGVMWQPSGDKGLGRAEPCLSYTCLVAPFIGYTVARDGRDWSFAENSSSIPQPWLPLLWRGEHHLLCTKEELQANRRRSCHRLHMPAEKPPFLYVRSAASDSMFSFDAREAIDGKSKFDQKLMDQLRGWNGFLDEFGLNATSVEECSYALSLTTRDSLKKRPYSGFVGGNNTWFINQVNGVLEYQLNAVANMSDVMRCNPRSGCSCDWLSDPNSTCVPSNYDGTACFFQCCCSRGILLPNSTKAGKGR